MLKLICKHCYYYYYYSILCTKYGTDNPILTKEMGVNTDIKTHSSVSLAKKTKKTCGTQVCYLPVPQSCQIQPSVSPKLLNQFLPNLYIFCLTHTLLDMSNLKEITLAVLEIFVPKNYPIFFTFSSSLHKITNTFKSHKNNLPMFRFLSNLEHL